MPSHRPETRSGVPLPRSCQWIADEPSADDSCKCGDPVVGEPRYPFCPAHLARAILPPDDPEKIREMRNCARYIKSRETPHIVLDWSWLW
jgi:hypothetical protein